MIVYPVTMEFTILYVGMYMMQCFVLTRIVIELKHMCSYALLSLSVMFPQHIVPNHISISLHFLQTNFLLPVQHIQVKNLPIQPLVQWDQCDM